MFPRLIDHQSELTSERSDDHDSEQELENAPMEEHYGFQLDAYDGSDSNDDDHLEANDDDHDLVANIEYANFDNEIQSDFDDDHDDEQVHGVDLESEDQYLKIELDTKEAIYRADYTRSMKLS